MPLVSPVTPLAFGSNTRPTPTRFGGPVNGKSIARSAGALTGIFSTLEEKPLADLLVRDLLCFIMPELMLARTWDEVKDASEYSFSLAAVTAGFSLLLPRFLKKLVKPITGVTHEELSIPLSLQKIEAMTPKAKLARMAVSFGFLFPFAAAFAVTPFFRNWMTLKRTGTTDYEEIIGLKPQQEHPHDEKYEKAVRHEKRTMAGIALSGIAAGAAAFLGFAAMARRAPQTLGGAMEQLFKTFSLKGAQSGEVHGTLPILLFWLLPPYIAQHFAARSRNEKIEQAIRNINSVLWFSLFTPLVTKGVFVRKFIKEGFEMGAEKIKSPLAQRFKLSIPSYRQLLKLEEPQRSLGINIKDTYSIFSYLIPIVMLAVSPKMLNIYLTRQRVMEQQQQKRQQAMANNLKQQLRQTTVKPITRVPVSLPTTPPSLIPSPASIMRPGFQPFPYSTMPSLPIGSQNPGITSPWIPGLITTSRAYS